MGNASARLKPAACRQETLLPKEEDNKMKKLNDMTPAEVINEYDRQSRREGWPPTEPELLAKFHWAAKHVSPGEAQGKTLARAIRQSAA
jgi:hypothetical protein